MQLYNEFTSMCKNSSHVPYPHTQSLTDKNT